MSVMPLGMKPTVCLDFDGVLNTYSGWAGAEELFEPAPGVREFLSQAQKSFALVIHSTRDPALIEGWLDRHDLSSFIHRVTMTKPLAIAYVDDRAIRFSGDFEAVLEQFRVGLRAHWEKT